jgi:hypothetical protein
MTRRLLLFCSLLYASSAARAGGVLYVGDSHSVGPFGWRLDALLRDSGRVTATYASCGSIAQWWVTGKPTPCGYFFRGAAGKTEKGEKGPTPIFADLMAQAKPQAVIVELGANYAGYPSDDYAVKDMAAMAEKIKAAGAACFWVTRPDSRKGREDIPRILELTYRAVADKCAVFDSTKVTKYPATGGDGIHYWFPEAIPMANAWAQAVFDWAAPGLPPAGRH